MPAAIVALVVGTLIRLIFFFTMPEEWAGLDTMIPPVIASVLFVVVALATQNKYPGKARHDVRDYSPPEEDVISGEDLKHFKFDTSATSAGGPDHNTPGPDDVEDDFVRKNAM